MSSLKLQLEIINNEYGIHDVERRLFSAKFRILNPEFKIQRNGIKIH